MKITPFKTAAALALCAIGLSAVAMGAAAQQEPFTSNASASGRTCFRVDQVEGFAPVKFSDSVDGVNLRVRNDVYQLQFSAPCPEIREASRVAVDSRNPVQVCTGSDVDIIAYSKVAPARCKANGIRKFDKSQVAALPASERP